MGKKLHVLTSRASEDLSGSSTSPYAASRLRQSLFHGSGAAPYPSPGSVSPQHDASRRRREMGWNTSFPAEYHRSLHSKDYQQTLAFEEQLRQREEIDADTMPLPCSTTKTQATGRKVVPRPNVITSTTKNKKLRDAELELHKCVTVREGLVSKLHELADSYTRDGSGDELAQNVLHLLLQLRDSSVNVMRAMAAWHTAQQPPLTAFRFQSDHYCVKMVMDLNFLATNETLSQSLGVDPTKMKQNPFMMPTPIPDREFADMCTSKAQPRFSFADTTERVAQAEKYLVWCLMHLPDVEDASDSSSETPQILPPPSYDSVAGDRSEMLLTWQQRAEQQLRLLSMPMEAPSGQIHVMDSSRMMKRKGYLPSLPSSPAKTLTELMQQNHLQQQQQQLPPPSLSPGGRRNNGSCFTSFEVELGDVTFRTTALDLELLGSHDTPPHAIVTLVAASVLILLSPSDRIPKDLSWPSCQKMLRDGVKLLRRMQRSGTVEQVAANVPPFKWKALLPFTENEHFEPHFLMEYSSAAATLCAWVLRVLRATLDIANIASGADDDRRELLEVLEQDDDDALTLQEEEFHNERASDSNDGGKRVKMGGAEVLFINENQPVSPPTSRPTSRERSGARSSMLLRTSPWTHRGVTYFVTFFLERREGEEDQLSLKMYEPMSSVESQMFLTAADLRMDFGRSAGEYFRRRDFGVLCDLILSQLDGMMMLSSASSAPSLGRLGSPFGVGTLDSSSSHAENSAAAAAGGASSRSSSRRSSRERRVSFDPVLEHSHEDEDAAAVRIQSLVRQQSAKREVAQLREEKQEQERETEAVVTIQSLARQRSAKLEVDRMRQERDATIRIQCAARQKQARNKVQRVRFAKQSELQAHQTQSATKIQSLARQRQAKKRVARLKLQQRQPTGLHPRQTSIQGDHDRDDEGDHSGMARPETSASYASEQFEDDFETDE